MKARPRLLPVLLAVAVAFGLTPVTAGRAAPTGSGKIADRGFGDLRNSFAWSMAWFKGRLYVGTARSQVCVEKATLDFYYPNRGYYNVEPNREVTCPRDRYDLDLRAEIWEYTPETRRWRLALRSPADLPNPRARGKFVARDIGFRGMQVYTEPSGKQALYVFGVTANEYIPELAAVSPPRVLRTTNGQKFTPLAGGPGIIDTPYGRRPAMGFRATAVHKGRLFATATSGFTGDGAVVEIKKPWSEKPRYEQISPATLSVFEMKTFNGKLYVGAGDARTGYSVWRTNAADSSPTFTPVVTAGAGRGWEVTSVVSMQVFKDRLYVGSSGWYSALFPASELIRINPDDSWSLIVGNSRSTSDGTFRHPLSGLPDGFGNIFNAHFWRMQPHAGALYLGTNDWSHILQTLPVLNRRLAGQFGFDVYGSCDGRSWFTATTNAFGANPYHYGVRTIVSTPAGFFLGSTNDMAGAGVWRDPAASPCAATPSSATATTSGAPRTATGLTASAGRCGTVLSWDRAPATTSYTIERAELQRVTGVGVAPPPPSPSGFRPPTPPNLVPGASGRPFSIPGSFEVVGVSAGTTFTDRTAVPGTAYLYRLVPRGSGSGLAATAGILPQAEAPAPAVLRTEVLRLVRREQLSRSVEQRLIELAETLTGKEPRYADLRTLLDGPALRQVRDSAARDDLSHGALLGQRHHAARRC
ncbi:hypothetical protein Vqi01_19920 [Micromonospora qiuiae]|uniref:Fibronectin type-III domain-containing protein n=1 Tax=Micromonospora qiuiae TaxID=502268 RepID=A0ABQ4J9J9_9ACTN|nr:hypothetical protein [Micromonospora qiuiae]GIJ26830.1 hypothetical protein Vqi01_19920 [Micromonospora qiuiae]